MDRYGSAMVDRRSRRTLDTRSQPVAPAVGATGGEGVDEHIIRAIQHFSRSPARAELARSLYRVGGKQLTPAQVDALETLASRAEWRMHEYAEALGINPGAASRTTDRLIKLALAERQSDESDRRYVIVRATASGRRTSHQIQRDRHALMHEVLKDLTDEQRAALADMLDHVTRAMDAALLSRIAGAELPRGRRTDQAARP
jgi:DNA-binding MarR family transcriptional regulator